MTRGARTLVGARPLAVLILVLAPLLFTDFYLSAVITKALWLGIAAVSLIFLAAYVGHGLARPGGALRHRRLHGREPRRGRRRLEDRLNPWVATLLGSWCGGGGRPLPRRDREPELRHLLPHDHARLRGAHLLLLRPGDGALGLRRREQRRPPGWSGTRAGSAAPVLHRARGLGRRLRFAPLHRPHALGPRAAGRSGRPVPDARARIQRPASAHGRVRPRRARRWFAGILSVWWNTRISPGSIRYRGRSTCS